MQACASFLVGYLKTDRWVGGCVRACVCALLSLLVGWLVGAGCCYPGAYGRGHNLNSGD